MAIRIRDPDTGREGTATPDALIEAVRGGAQVLEPVEIYDPESKKTGVAAPEALASALQSGAIPVGARAHKVATTSKLESFARDAAQGFSFDLQDEIQALSPGNVLKGIYDGNPVEAYRKSRDAYREDNRIAEEANPITSLAGRLTGGIASAFVPGVGAIGQLQRGAKFGQILKSGAEMGALDGFGASEADLTKGEVGKAALDTAKGALYGGLGNLLFEGAGKVISGAGGIVKRGLSGAFDPDVQRAVALGGKTKEMSSLLQGAAKGQPSKEKRALDELAKQGLFEGSPSGAELMQRFANFKKQAGAEIQDAINKVGDDTFSDNVQDVFLQASQGKANLGERLSAVVERARADEVGNAQKAAEEVFDRIMKSEGNLRDLWETKVILGEHAQNAFAKLPKERAAADRIYIEANDHLDDILTKVTDAVAKRHNIPGLSEANAKYAAVSTWEKQLAKQEGASKWQAVVGNLRVRDAMAGTAGSAALMAMGVDAEVAMPLGLAASGVHAAVRSTPGRLARARIGEQMRAMSQAAAQQAGKMPRTTPALQKMTQQYLGAVQGALPPQLSQRLQQFATTQNPQEAASMLRSLMGDSMARSAIMNLPGLVQMLSPSKYDTEIDGHVFSPEDKMRAAKDYSKLGLSPVEEAQKVSEVYRTGKLDPSLYAPAPPDYGDIIEQFNSRITELGY